MMPKECREAYTKWRIANPTKAVKFEGCQWSTMHISRVDCAGNRLVIEYVDGMYVPRWEQRND